MAATATQNIMLNLVASMNAGNKPASSGDNASANQFGTTLTQQLQARQSEQMSQTADAASHEPPPAPMPAATPTPASSPASNAAAGANKSNTTSAAQPANQAAPQQTQAATTANSAAASNNGNTTNSGKTAESGKASGDRKAASKDAGAQDNQAADQAASGAAATVLSQLQNLLNDNGGANADTGRAGGLGERLLGGHDPKAIAARETAVGGDSDPSSQLDDKLTAALATDTERQALPVGTSATANTQGSFADLLDRKLQIADAGQIRQQMAAPVVTKTDARTQAADTAKPTASIYQAVGAEGWDSALGTKVVMMVSNQQQEVEMHLNPPHLGPIDVKLTLDQDQATVTFVAAHANVRDAIQNSVPTLNQMLAESGIQLSQANVQARNQESGNQQSSGQGSRRGGKQGDQEDSKITPVGWQPRAIGGLPGNVNLFI